MDRLEPRQREAISALMDGELAPEQVQQHLTALSQDREARRCWLSFHSSRDALHTLSPSQLDDIEFLNRFSDALSREPAHLFPAAKPIRSTMTHWSSWGWAGASVAAVLGFFTWFSLPSLTSEQPFGTGTQPTARVAVSEVVTLPESYLLAHQQYSPALSWQGAVPYVRTAAWSPEITLSSTTAGALQK